MAARLALACTLQLNLSPSSQAKDDNARVHWPEQQELHPGQSISRGWLCFWPSMAPPLQASSLAEVRQRWR